MRYSCNRRGREDASADIWSQDGIATETTARCQLGKTCVCESWIEPKRNRQFLACSGLVQLKWPAAGILARFLPPSCTSRTIPKTLGKHEIVRFLSSPLKNPGFPRVFRISGQLLWPTVAPMQLGAWGLRRCISRRATQIESFFESRESPKH
jgi:hypothetical protein